VVAPLASSPASAEHLATNVQSETGSATRDRFCVVGAGVSEETWAQDHI
jgi:hypothetical protein